MFTNNVCIMFRPKSRGQVKLRSSNPYDKPLFYAGYFTHPDDMKVINTIIIQVSAVGIKCSVRITL